MFVTLVAVLCHVLPGGPGDCVEEIVTDSNQSNITFQRSKARSALLNGCPSIRSTMPTGRSSAINARRVITSCTSKHEQMSSALLPITALGLARAPGH